MAALFPGILYDGPAADAPHEDGLRPGLILDRDGTIIADVGYIADPGRVCLIDGAAALIRRANRAGIPVGIATNQSGLARRLFDEDAYRAVQARMVELLHREGARIDAVCACPFHPDFTPGFGPEHARWRKPGPAMVQFLAARLGLDPARSVMIGDSDSDLLAAAAAGLASGVQLVPSGHPHEITHRGRMRLVRASGLGPAAAAVGDVLDWETPTGAPGGETPK